MITNKKIIAPISLSLSLLLITPSAIQAVQLDDFVLSTSTSAGSWSDPLGGGTYLYGGDFKFKLKNSTSHAPIFQYRMPGIKLGCSGMSIEGGFLSYLGLSNLQEMLSNAGSSLVMGIFIGLEFSLPAVSAVFAKIRDWANALQALLQNGCNIGKALSNGGFGKFAYDTELDKKIGGPFTAANDFISKGDNALSALKDLAECDGDPANTKCSLEGAMKKALHGELKEQLSKKNVAASASSISTNMLLGIVTPSNKDITMVTDLNALYSGGSVGCGLATTALSQENKLFDSLKYIFFGDIGADDEFIGNYTSKLEADGCSVSNAVLSKEGGRSVTTGGKSTLPTPVAARIEPIIADPRDAATFLVFGGSEINGKYNLVTGTEVSIPNRKILYFDLATDRDADNNAVSKERAAFLSAKKEPLSAYTISWNGIFKESLKSIRDNINAQTGYTSPGINYEAYNTSAVTTSTAPLLIPSIKKYMSIISKIEKKANMATPESEMLKVNLAKANAILYSRELMGAMESRVLSLLDGNKGDIEAINNMARHIRETSIEIKKILKEMENDIGRTGFMEEFEKIEKEQRLESVKTNR